MTHEKAARVGAAAVALGLCLAGPQAAVAAADSQDGSPSADSGGGRSGAPASKQAPSARSSTAPAERKSPSTRSRAERGSRPTQAVAPAAARRAERPAATVAGPDRQASASTTSPTIPAPTAPVLSDVTRVPTAAADGAAVAAATPKPCRAGWRPDRSRPRSPISPTCCRPDSSANSSPGQCCSPVGTGPARVSHHPPRP